MSVASAGIMYVASSSAKSAPFSLKFMRANAYAASTLVNSSPIVFTPAINRVFAK